MMGYAVCGYQFARQSEGFPALKASRIGQLADSLYFLGFLWTLWALIDSFVIHQLSIAEAVFRTFGYALVTTATGMFLRLLLLQFQHAGGELKEWSEREMALAIEDFRKELRRTIRVTKSFGADVSNATKVWIESFTDSTKALETATENVKDQTVDLEQALIELHKANKEMAGKQVEEMAAVTLKRVEEAMKTALDGFNNGTNSVINSLRTTVHNVEKEIAADMEQRRSEVKEMVLLFKKALNEHVKEMQNIRSSLEGISGQIQRIKVPDDIVEKTIASQITVAITPSVRKATDDLKSAISELSNAVRTASDEVHKSVRALRTRGPITRWLLKN
ncbi:MAG: hypothetical protein GXX84_18830 [Acidobacteria bacterium]|nr:hypothetical protein [Acidobacteriota bacterium]